MKVYLIPGPGEPLRVAPGPADLQGASGRAILTGAADETEQARWAVALGLFAARGGSIEWRPVL